MEGLLTASQLIKSEKARKYLKRTKDIKHVIHHKDSNIAFILTETKTIVVTSSGAFLMEPLVVRGDLWRRRLMKIRRLIVERKIKDYNDLVLLCRPGITMTFVKVEWYA